MNLQVVNFQRYGYVSHLQSCKLIHVSVGHCHMHASFTCGYASMYFTVQYCTEYSIFISNPRCPEASKKAAVMQLVLLYFSRCLCLVTQLCLILCDPMDCSPPGSSVHGNSPGKNTGVGFHALLQGNIPTQGLKPGLLHCRWIVFHLSHQGSKYLINKGNAHVHFVSNSRL